MTVDEAEVLARGAHGERTGRNPGMAHAGAEADTAYGAQPKSEKDWLMSQVVERGNMQVAYNRVMKNRGAPGIDGMRCEELKAWLKANWVQTKQKLLDGTYRPQAVRRVDIPKPQGGVRTLGVPTRWSTDSSSKHCIRPCNPCLGQPSRRAATAFVRAGVRGKRLPKRHSTSVLVSAGWWTWTWRNSLTELTTTC